VREGVEVEPGRELVEWDPFTSAILSEIAGKVEFQDIVEGGERPGGDRQGHRPLAAHHRRGFGQREARPGDHGARTRRARSGVTCCPRARTWWSQRRSRSTPGDTLVKIPRETYEDQGHHRRSAARRRAVRARSPKEPAIITEIDGSVRLGRRPQGHAQGDRRERLGDIREYLVPRSIHINVQEGERVRAGDSLIDGPINPHDVLQVLGEKELQRYLTDKIQEVYRSQSVAINDKHIEVIVRQMMRSVKIEEVGDTEFLIDEQVDRWRSGRERPRRRGRRQPAIGRPLLLGITKASLSTDSFISAASFQETTRVLTEAAIIGKVDYLRGLKENVIVGR
jgi:DNA-directed RNA polymerase subunit beta'